MNSIVLFASVLLFAASTSVALPYGAGTGHSYGDVYGSVSGGGGGVYAGSGGAIVGGHSAGGAIKDYGHSEGHHGHHGGFLRDTGYGYEKKYGYDRVYAKDHGYGAHSNAHGHHASHGSAGHHGQHHGAHYNGGHHHGAHHHGNHHGHHYGHHGHVHPESLFNPHLTPYAGYPLTDVYPVAADGYAYNNLYGHMGLGGYGY